MLWTIILSVVTFFAGLIIGGLSIGYGYERKKHDDH